MDEGESKSIDFIIYVKVLQNVRKCIVINLNNLKRNYKPF